MPSKYARKRKHDLDQDTSEDAPSETAPRKKPDRSPSKRSRKTDKDDDAESMSIEETNKMRASLGLPPLEVDEPPTGDADTANGHPEGGEIFKEHGMEIVHKAAKNITEDKEAQKLREKLELQREKHRIYSKVLKVNKGLAESDDEEDASVDNFLEKIKLEAEKKARMFDEMDQEAEKEAAAMQKKTQQERRAKEARRRKREEALTAGLVVGHSKEAFADGTETILVLQDKNVLDEDGEEVLVNPNLLDDERHKRNVELRKKKSNYTPYDDEEVDEFGNVKKQSILAKYDEELEGEKKRETFRLNEEGGYDLDQEAQEQEMKRRLMMANKKFETLEMPKYTPAREFYTEEEMFTFRKPKKSKKDKLRKSKTLKVDELQAEGETEEEKAARAKRLAARRQELGEPVDTEAPKNGFAKPSTKEKKPEKEIEEGELEDTEAAPQVGRSKWKEATGASVDLSRIRSLAAKVGEEDEESDEDDGVFQGVDMTGVVIDDEAEDELQGALERARKLRLMAEEREAQENEAKRVREMLAKHGAIKQEPDAAASDEEEGMQVDPPFEEEGITIDATSEQYKMIGEIPTFGLAGNRNDQVDYSELIEEHKRIAEQQIKKQQDQEPRYSDESDTESRSEIRTHQLKRRGSDVDMDELDLDERKPMWKPVGDEPGPSTSRKHDPKRSYRRDRSKQDEDHDEYGADYKNVLGEERDVTKGVGAMLRLAAEKGYLEGGKKTASGGALGHLESKRFSRVDQGRMEIEDKYMRKLERMGTTGTGPIRSFSEKSDYKPNVEISYTDERGRALDRKEAFRQLSWKFHGKKPGKKQLEKRNAKVQKKERMKKMNSMDTPLGTLQKQRKKQEQAQTPYLLLSGSNRDDIGAPLQKD